MRTQAEPSMAETHLMVSQSRKVWKLFLWGQEKTAVLTVSTSIRHRTTVLVRASRQERHEGTYNKREQIKLFAADINLGTENHKDTKGYIKFQYFAWYNINMPNQHCLYILIVKRMNEILFILATLTKQANKRTGVEDVQGELFTHYWLIPSTWPC